MLPCPLCSEPLVHDTRASVEVDACPAHGMFLDKSELFRITENERYAANGFQWTDVFRAEASPPRRDKGVDCPHCKSTMELDVYKKVQIDVCKEHGVWLDAGELDAIINNLRTDPGYIRGVALRVSDATL